MAPQVSGMGSPSRTGAAFGAQQTCRAMPGQRRAVGGCFPKGGAMNALVVSHQDGSDPPAFEVHRVEDGDVKRSRAVAVPPPVGFPVEGASGTDLMAELRWYLEEFLDYPFPPWTDRAERVQAALRRWAEAAFGALFGGGSARDWYTAAASGPAEGRRLLVSSDEPGVLAWPWEALRDPQRDFLAMDWHVERKLNTVADPMPLPKGLPRDRVNVLLVTARPLVRDVQFRSISRPLVELIDSLRLPAEVTLLRPPTFDALREHLAQNPDTYHIVHFDGHGGYGAAPGGGGHSPFVLHARGTLVFEDDDGKADAIDADQLSALLREHRIPAVVLNACQSGMVDPRADSAFASVAAALIRAGIRSVVAMAYSLYVSAAQQFLPAFYRRLFETGDLAQPTRAGRRQMLADPKRVCARGTFPLADWIVPVVYQQRPMDFSFAAAPAAPPEAEEEKPELPEGARDEENPYGFIGRDGAVLELERAMRRPPAGILIHGLGGIGKSTLARGFVKWLRQTGGLGAGCIWLAFNDVHSAEYVLNAVGTAVFGPQFIPTGVEQKIKLLAEALKDNRLTIVWDNFESASGIEAAGVSPLLTDDDRRLLRRFLAALGGGATKVLITSRGEEDWLGATNRWKLSLAGLAGEERWEFSRVILRDLGMTIDRDDPDLCGLMDALDGHPLLMRAILPKLADRPAAAILSAVQGNLDELGLAGDATQDKVLATLRFVEKALPEDLRPLLVPLGLHERFVDADYLEEMAKPADPDCTRQRIAALLAALSVAGLVRDRGQRIYELHPALTGFLRSRPVADESASEGWTRAFVDVMGSLADALTPKELHQQRWAFHVHGANFRCALRHAERLDMHEDFAALTQCLGSYALHTRDLKGAEDLFTRLAKHHADLAQQEHEAAAYHQLGRIAEERRDFTEAQKWYLKSLEIAEKEGHEHGAASTYHQLGMVAQGRRDFAEAEKWYLKALPIFEKLGIEHGAASTYHQLGYLAQERRDFAEAEKWYAKSLAIKERLGDEHGAASTYHQLGMVAQGRRDFAEAEKWYLKSLEIEERLGDEHGAATTYHQLGRVAQERRDFAEAEKWYLKSLAIEEKQGDEHGAAMTYHQLGIVAVAAQQLGEAEKWFLKSLEIEERQGNEHGAGITCSGLGAIARERGDVLESGRWLVRAVRTFLETNDPHEAARNGRSFRLTYERADAGQRKDLERMWREAGLGDLPPAEE